MSEEGSEVELEGDDAIGDLSPTRSRKKKHKSKRKSHSSSRPDPPASREFHLLSEQENGYSQFNYVNGKTYDGTDTGLPINGDDNGVEVGNYSDRYVTKSSFLATSDDPFASRGTYSRCL